MMKEMRNLIEEREKYERHNENPRLQSDELDSIARAMLYVSKTATELDAEEISAINWANKRLGIV